VTNVTGSSTKKQVLCIKRSAIATPRDDRKLHSSLISPKGLTNGTPLPKTVTQSAVKNSTLKDISSNDEKEELDK
jgi:hypothetical protein